MGKLYWTKDIKKILDKKIDGLTMSLINDNSVSPEQAPAIIRHIRLLRDFSNELIDEMEQLDREDDERYAAIKSTEAETDGKDNV